VHVAGVAPPALSGAAMSSIPGDCEAPSDCLAGGGLLNPSRPHHDEISQADVPLGEQLTPSGGYLPFNRPSSVHPTSQTTSRSAMANTVSHLSTDIPKSNSKRGRKMKCKVEARAKIATASQQREHKSWIEDIRRKIKELIPESDDDDGAPVQSAQSLKPVLSAASFHGETVPGAMSRERRRFLEDFENGEALVFSKDYAKSVALAEIEFQLQELGEISPMTAASALEQIGNDCDALSIISEMAAIHPMPGAKFHGCKTVCADLAETIISYSEALSGVRAPLDDLYVPLLDNLRGEMRRCLQVPPFTPDLDEAFACLSDKLLEIMFD
jgi:hypothetical protein